MAVALVGHNQLVWAAAGVHTPAWPAGTAAGHVVIGRSGWGVQWDRVGPRQTGWTALGGNVWWRRLTAADVTEGPGTWDGRLLGLVTVSGARGLGRVAEDRGVRLDEADSGMLVTGWTDSWESDHLDYPTSGRLGTEVVGEDRQKSTWWLRTYSAAGVYRIERDDAASGYRSFELLPLRAPDQPVITAPTAGAHLDVAAPVTIGVLHQSVSGQPQEAVRVRVRQAPAGAWQYVNPDGGTLSATEQTITTGVGVIPIVAGQLTAGSYEVQAATSESGLWSEWSGSTGFVLEQAPSLADVVLTTVAGDMTPVGSWTPTTPGGVQVAWDAVIVPAGAGVDQAVTVRRVVPGAATSWIVPAQSWVKGGSYQLLVRVQQTGGLWTQWVASAAAVIDWTAPAAPGSLAVIAGSPLEVQVDGLAATSLAVSVEWAAAYGDEWTPLARVDGPIGSTVVKVPSAPYGVARRYRVCSWETIDGVWLPSAWVVSQPVASVDEYAYLVDGDDITDWLQVCVQDPGQLVVQQGITVSYPLTDDDQEARALVDKTPPVGREGSFTLLCTSEPDVDEVVSWLTGRGQWTMRWSPEHDQDRVMRDRAGIVMTLSDKVQIRHAVIRRAAARLLSVSWCEQ